MIDYNKKLELHLFWHGQSGQIKLHRGNYNRTNVSIIGTAYDEESAKEVAALLGCKLEVLQYTDKKNDCQYLPERIQRRETEHGRPAYNVD